MEIKINSGPKNYLQIKIIDSEPKNNLTEKLTLDEKIYSAPKNDLCTKNNHTGKLTALKNNSASKNYLFNTNISVPKN